MTKFSRTHGLLTESSPMLPARKEPSSYRAFASPPPQKVTLSQAFKANDLISHLITPAKTQLLEHT